MLLRQHGMRYSRRRRSPGVRDRCGERLRFPVGGISGAVRKLARDRVPASALARSPVRSHGAAVRRRAAGHRGAMARQRPPGHGAAFDTPPTRRDAGRRVCRLQGLRLRRRRALQPYDVLRIQKLRDDSLPFDRLFGVTRMSMSMNAHAVALYGPLETWRTDNIDRSYRKELDKKGRQIRRKGHVRFGISFDPGEITATFHRMREYRRPRFQNREDPDLLQSATYFDFYLDLAIAGAHAGFCRTYTLWLDSRPISGVWGLVHQGQFLVVLGGFDLAGFKNCSIGALVFEAVAGDCIAKGERVLDFTIGDESYKRLFGMQPTAMWTLSGAGSQVGSLVGFVSGQMPWTMRLAKRIVNGKAMI